MTAPVVDLFLSALVDAPLKDERATLEHPFFSIQKQPRRTPILYDNGQGVRVEIEPGPRGIATIWDRDILIFASSVINDRIERRQPVSPTVRFAAHDFLTVTRRGTGKTSYELFLDALDRLRSTNIRTIIEAGGARAGDRRMAHR